MMYVCFKTGANSGTSNLTVPHLSARINITSILNECFLWSIVASLSAKHYFGSTAQHRAVDAFVQVGSIVLQYADASECTPSQFEAKTIAVASQNKHIKYLIKIQTYNNIITEINHYPIYAMTTNTKN